MKRSKKFYVAYGSNLHRGQMRYRCPDATVYGTGVVKNYSLTFWGNSRGCGVATILPGAKTDVPVAVWEISAADEKSLDHYEGYPHLYRKENIDVIMDDGATVTGIVYIMNYGTAADPSPFYYETIAHGYCDFGFDLAFLQQARQKIYLEDSGETWIMFKLNGRHLSSINEVDLYPGKIEFMKEQLSEKYNCQPEDIHVTKFTPGSRTHRFKKLV